MCEDNQHTLILTLHMGLPLCSSVWILLLHLPWFSPYCFGSVVSYSSISVSVSLSLSLSLFVSLCVCLSFSVSLSLACLSLYDLLITSLWFPHSLSLPLYLPMSLPLCVLSLVLQDVAR